MLYQLIYFGATCRLRMEHFELLKLLQINVYIKYSNNDVETYLEDELGYVLILERVFQGRSLSTSCEHRHAPAGRRVSPHPIVGPK